ncbi:hypothetical protein [Desulfovibrio cuneatus]|uniref:hypothetical protein n=1 Tax=Desulfovibrio cuneatus TaxID=159728 RepID=UPI00041DAF6B|nr:hypothetical protein [Desulfovibrio cuneatus]
MSIENVPLLSVVQLAQAEKTLETLQNNAQAQQAVLQDQAAVDMKKREQQVEKTQPAEKKRRRSVDDKPDNKGASYHSSKNGDKRPKEDQEPEPAPTAQTPWIGIMVNRKI